MEKYSAVVLAGGKATRLGGRNKAKLEIGGQRLLDRVLNALRPIADQILVVGHLADEFEPSDFERMPDVIPGASALMGAYTGLTRARHDLAIIVGCDMPFLRAPLLDRVARSAAGHDVAVPRVGPHLEALHAAYRKSCIPIMEEALRRGRHKIIDFYPDVDTFEVPESEVVEFDPDLLSFLNINTPADLDRARHLASRPWTESGT
ncbi:MAG TPA: molybdenum cofactor guanylyltransferase [Chloroflexota bacterium]|nr:molybdenum cofactor guanylyltransferase [Chloroflexota bacterium]